METVTRFDGRAADYSRYRERYDAEEILSLLREWSGLRPDWTVADIGAGTGMLADVFLANGNRVIAIEPNAEMRAICAQLHEGNTRMELRDGTAEATGLPYASVEMIAAGRALHWFDLDAAMREFRRVVRPGGWFLSVAAGRAEDGREENRAFTALLNDFTRGATYRERAYKSYSRLPEFFADGGFHHAERNGTMQMDWEQLRGMTLSLSHAPRADEQRFPEFERALRRYFEQYASDGSMTLATRCWINAGRLA